MKKLMAMGLPLAALGTSLIVPAQQALALGWDANDMITRTTGSTGVNVATINQQTLSNWVTSLTTWIVGLAIVIFVLKVVFTAVDRMIFSKDGGKGAGGGNDRGKDDGGILCKIPLVGGYDASMSWKEIWIQFGKNVAIVAGAWLLVQILVGVVLFIFSAVTKTSS